MRRSDNAELRRKVLNHLADLYNIKEVREHNHLSSYITCRTKSFLNYKQAAEPNDDEVMLFALGYGLQDVLTPKDAEAPLVDKHGILYRPDMILSIRQNEIKTTRKSARNHYLDEYIPQTWLDYMMGGCYMMETQEYDLIVLYMMGNYAPPFPQLYCDTFYFNKMELEGNWEKVMMNKEVLDAAVKSGVPPIPFANCFDWECRHCRYILVCNAIAASLGVENKSLKEDQEQWQ